MKKGVKSQRLFERASSVLVGGVNSPVRAFKAVGGSPLFIRKAKGPMIQDADGRSYIDFVGSWGPMILGHAHPAVIRAIKSQAASGVSFGAPSELEVRLAEIILGAFRSMEKIRFMSSGTEAAMTAVRLARAKTGRDIIIKFSGCYHGHADSLLVKAGSGAATLGIPDSAGVSPSVSRDTVVLPYNDLAAAEKCFSEIGNAVAGLIVEPIAANMGVVPPEAGYLKGLRELTLKSGSVLIFDEVLSGFRAAWGGAQTLYGIRPDLTCLGKIIGGGLPAGAVGGRKEIMDLLAPLGPVYQAGTLSGNPLAMASGLKTLEELKRRKPYRTLEALTKKLCGQIRARAEELGLALAVNQAGSLFTVFLCPGPVKDFDSAKTADTSKFARFFHALLDGGVSFPPSQFEAAFVSAAHGPSILNKASRIIQKALEAAAVH